MKTLQCLLFLLIPFIVSSQNQDLRIFGSERVRIEWEEEKIYSEYNEENQFGIVVLSDWGYLKWSDHPDSSFISQKVLQASSKDNWNYHELNSQKRRLFLECLNIRETDKIFIYNFPLDTVITYELSEAPVVAFLEHGGGGVPFDQRDFEIGIRLLEFPQMVGDYATYNNVAYIGDENPFLTGNVKPIQWQMTDSTKFPDNLENLEFSQYLEDYDKGETFIFSLDSVNIFLQNIIDERLIGRHLAVVNSKTDSVIFQKILFDGESAGLRPIPTEETNYHDDFYQWTGKLFKNKPTIIYGLIYENFAFRRIHLLDATEPAIYIWSDSGF